MEKIELRRRLLMLSMAYAGDVVIEEMPWSSAPLP